MTTSTMAIIGGLKHGLPTLMPVRTDEGYNLTFVEDPGHGWLVISRSLALDVLNPVGGLGLISGCSYFAPALGLLFLEEDCDAGVLLAAWQRQPQLGKLTTREHYVADHTDFWPTVGARRFEGHQPELDARRDALLAGLA